MSPGPTGQAVGLTCGDGALCFPTISSPWESIP